MRSYRFVQFFLAGVLLLGAAAACRAAAQVGRPASGETSAGAASAAGTATIQVVAQEFALSLDATQARAGAITFVVRNDGQTEHDFSISGEGVSKKTRMLNPGETETLEVTLTPWTYTYICTVLGHKMLGMSGTFTVTSN